MNPADPLKNVQELQRQMQQSQDRLRAEEVEGTSGGGMVRVRMTAAMEVLGVTIDPQAIDPEDPGLTADLCRAAMTDAVHKARERARETMGSLASSLGIDPNNPGAGLGI